MLRPCRLPLLLWQAALRLSYHAAAASLCLGGADIFASVPENSPAGHFVADIVIGADPAAGAIRLCLTGQDADWFYLEGRSIRLNTSASRVLDREALALVLIAELTCYEDDVMQGHYRVLVEILNQNDNAPAFLPETVRPFTINELAAVDSVVFSVKALDADRDSISYIIDESSPDADFFRIDLPSSGNVVLNRPLDYETKPHLQLLLWAQESNTAEKFNASALLSIDVSDGDDQYPHFLPCAPLMPGLPVCTNPTYSTNISHRHQDVVLEFSPGPIRAQDGDRGIDSPLIYTILSGDDGGRFVMDNHTGDITLTRAASDLRQTRNFSLSVMVSQADDRLKYSVASVVVRVLYENAFPPAFNRTTFKGFLVHSSSPASIVSTYGNQVLQLQASDRDFSDGRNPNVRYALRPPSGLYQVTQDGVLIARTDRLRAFDRHILQVVARDEESGEEAAASVDIEVLLRGQAVPRGAFADQQLLGHVDSHLAGGIALMMLVVFLSAVLFLLLRTVRRGRLPEAEDAAGARKQSSVRLLWSQAVNSSPPIFLDEAAYNLAFCRQYESSQTDSFHGPPGLYTRRLSQRPPPTAPAELADPAAGLCRFQTELFSVVEKPAGTGHTWEIVMAPQPSDPPTGESPGCYGDDITDANSVTSQKSKDAKKGQSEDTEGPGRTLPSSVLQPIAEQDTKPIQQPIAAQSSKQTNQPVGAQDQK